MPTGQDDSDRASLRGLEKVDWGAIQHAYGPATDVPGLLRAVACGSEDEQRDALTELWSNVWHQGTVYEATAHAVPFLARLAADDSMGLEHRGSLMYLLSAIAAGSGYLEVHKDLIRGWSEREEEQMRHEKARVLAARSAVARALQEAFPDASAAPAELRPGLLNIAHHLGPAASDWAPNVALIMGRNPEPAQAILLELTEHAIRGEAAPSGLLEQARSLDPEIDDVLTGYPPNLIEETVADRLTEILLRPLFDAYPGPF